MSANLGQLDCVGMRELSGEELQTVDGGSVNLVWAVGGYLVGKCVDALFSGPSVWDAIKQAYDAE